MLAADLAELHRVNDEAHVAVSREPLAVMLVARFVSEAHAVLHHVAVAAHVEDRGQAARGFFRAVKIRRHVKAGQRLVVHVLHDESVALHLAGLLDFQRRALRHRIEPEHLRNINRNDCTERFRIL